MVEHADLIGVPFVIGARGPDAFDCYGLVRELYQRAHGVELPDFHSPDSMVAQHCALAMAQTFPSCWRQVERAPGAIALIRVDGLACHVGFLLDADTLCHTWLESGGVCTEPVATWERRIVGFYRHAR